MKKIIGITLILAVAFFNMSLILDSPDDIDFAKLTQISSANAEETGGGTYALVIHTAASTATLSWINNEGELCEKDCDVSSSTDCLGTGSVICTPKSATYSNCSETVCG